MKRQLPFLYKVYPSFYHSNLYKYFILLATFLAYLSFHASRKPITIVKAQLHHNCSSDHHDHPETNSTTWCDWKPFDGDNYWKEGSRAHFKKIEPNMNYGTIFE